MYVLCTKFGKKIYVYVIGFKIWFMYFKRHLGLSESITSESKPSVKIHTFKMNAPLEIKWTKNHFFALVWKLDFCSNNVIQKLGWILCIDFFFLFLSLLTRKSRKEMWNWCWLLKKSKWSQKDARIYENKKVLVAK